MTVVMQPLDLSPLTLDFRPLTNLVPLSEFRVPNLKKKSYLCKVTIFFFRTKNI